MKLQLKISTLLFGFLFSSFVYATETNCQKILTFADGVRQELQGAEGVALQTYSFVNPVSDKAIVMAVGLGDDSELAEENIQYFYHAGYSIFVMDHRGQGRSGFYKDQVNSHVDSYENYIVDFSLFINTIVQPSKFSKTFLLGNSMGAAVGFLYMRNNPGVISKAAFVAPMNGIKFSPRITNLIARLGMRFQGPEGSFFTDYHPPLSRSTFTSDVKQYQMYEGFFQAHSRSVGISPEYTIPGYSPSHNWMLEANKMTAEIQSTQADQMTAPVLVFTAGKDQLVDNRATTRLASRFPNMTVINLATSRHGVLYERDEIRNPLRERIVEFLQ